MLSTAFRFVATALPASGRAVVVCWLACLAAIVVCAGAAHASAAAGEEARALRAHNVQLDKQIRKNAFGLPVYLHSLETGNSLEGEIYARVNYPFATVHAVLRDPSHWCEILNLHPNTKYCQASGSGASTVLVVNAGTKREQELKDTHQVTFAYQVRYVAPDFFQVRLHADEGPLSTRDYRIVLEAVAIDGNKTFLRLTYAYSYGFAGRLALKAYLATIGSDKAGFTVVGKQRNGKPAFIDGVRGLVERNTLRYYLGIDASLATAALPPALQRDARLQHWFIATERYPRQLHEMDMPTYLQMKRNEYARQDSLR